jgi:hypothetical protein
MKGKSTRLRNATRVELWQRFQRPIHGLQLWRALAQRLLDVTSSLPDLPSIHTFLPQIEVTIVQSGGLTYVGEKAASQACGISTSNPGTGTFLDPPFHIPGWSSMLCVKQVLNASLVIRDKGHPQFLDRTPH